MAVRAGRSQPVPSALVTCWREPGGLKAWPLDRRLRGRWHELCRQKAETRRSFCPGRWYPPPSSGQTPAVSGGPPSPPQCWACSSRCQPLSGPVWGQMAMWASCQKDDYGCCTWGWAHFPGTCGPVQELRQAFGGTGGGQGGSVGLRPVGPYWGGARSVMPAALGFSVG